MFCMENKTYLKRFFLHLHKINRHKRIVTGLCFKCGMISQGIKHDLSKYTPVEFFAGVKYYQGFRSPIDAEKADKGYSLGWLHHEGRNRHHWEHWIDKNYSNYDLFVLNMPFNYLLESILDRIAASKNYNPNYTDSSPLEFFDNGKDRHFMGEENCRRVRLLLKYLADNGEHEAIKYYKSLYKKWKKDKSFDI